MITIVPVPCLRDNYAYLGFCAGSSECFVVDPGEAAPVAREIERRGLRLVAIACTHHHADHVGGNLELATSGVEVYGHRLDRRRIPGLTREVEHDGQVVLAESRFRVLYSPGHTLGAVSYVGEGVAFTGDTLFCGGCGRLFEGSPAQMHDSLTRVLGSLPDETLVYTGHEYTQANLEFALGLEPKNDALRERLSSVRSRRAAGLFCAAAPLGLERQTNPFLRCESPELRAGLGLDGASSVAVFTELRARKDRA